MLGRLIKYDLKSSGKLFILLHGIFLIFCILMRFIYMDRLDLLAPVDEKMLVVSLLLFFTIFTVFVSALMFYTLMQIAFRYYRNLFSKEGYLSWTLPVSGIQHLWAKIISGCIFMAADTLIVAAGILILATGKNIRDAYSLIADEITRQLGMTLGDFGLILLILCLASCICNVVMIYFCINIGQLFPGHRVLCAVAAYIITSTVIQTGSLIILFIFGYFPGYEFFAAEGATAFDFMINIYVISGVISAVVTVAMYIASHYIMKKKINLI